MEEEEEVERENVKHQTNKVRKRGGRTILAGMEKSANVTSVLASMRPNVIVSAHTILPTDAQVS